MHDHLDDSVIPQLQWSTDKRIESCREERLVEYPFFQSALDALDLVVNYPHNHRAHSVLLAGDSDNGKSTLLRTFRERHPPRIAEDGSMAFSTCYFKMPGKPNEDQFLSELLRAYGVRATGRMKPADKRDLVTRNLKQFRCGAIVVDEFNHISNAGKEAVPLLNAIKNLSDDTGINIAAAGTKAAKNVIEMDDQLDTRYKVIDLPVWQLDGAYLAFLAGYERLLPLAQPSNLHSKELAPRIHALVASKSKATSIGGTVDLVKELAVLALEQGQERIDGRTLNAWEAKAKVLTLPPPPPPPGGPGAK